MMITKILTFILVAYAAYFFGGFASGLVAPWEYDVSGKAFAEYHKAIDAYMGARMPIFVLSYLFFMALFLFLYRKNWKGVPFLGIVLAIFLQVLLIIIGINSNVAMNPMMNAWNPDQLPADWQEVRNQWLGYHNKGKFINIPLQIIVFISCYFYWTKETTEK